MSELFVSTPAAASTVGISTRHFLRLAEGMGLRPMIFHGASLVKYFYTPDQVAAVERRWARERRRRGVICVKE